MNLKRRIRLPSSIILIVAFLLSLSLRLPPDANVGVCQQFAQAAPPAVEVRIKNLRKQGEHLVKVRTRILNTGINRLEKAKRISDEDGDDLVADLQTNIEGLNSLKDKINAETDFDVLKSYVKSIFVDYRIFMVVVPRNRGLFAAARLNHVIGKLENVSSKLESLINTYREEGKDTAEAEEYLNTLETDLANAKSDVDQAKSTFSSMTPEKDEEAGSTVKSGIESLKEARTDLKDAAKQAKKIVSWLKAID